MGVVYRATQLGLDRAGRAEGDRLRARRQPRLPQPLQVRGAARGLDRPPERRARSTRPARPRACSTSRCATSRAPTCARWSTAGRRARRRSAPCGSSGRSRAALDAAHRRGLVHRDVKPPNVLIAHEGEEHAYLTDFGLTKHAAAAGGFTRTGQFVGTPDFAAPEQIRGEQADARADVYALGCVLFHALTGRVPFPRDSELAKMYAHLSDPAPAASALAPGRPRRRSTPSSAPRWPRSPASATPPPATSRAPPGPRCRARPRRRRPAASPPARPPRPRRARPTRPRRARRRRPASPPLPAAGAPATSPLSSAAAPAAEPKPAGPAGWPQRPPHRAARRAARACSWPRSPSPRSAPPACSAATSDDAAAERPAATPTATATPPRRPAARRSSPRSTVGDGPDGITADGKRVFVSHARTGTLREIDAERDELVGEPSRSAPTPTRSPPARARVWVVDASSDELQRLQTEPELLADRDDPGRQGRAGHLARRRSSPGSRTPATTPCSAIDRASATARRRPDRRRRPPDRHLRRLEGLGDELPRRDAVADRHRHRPGRGRPAARSATAPAA